jgi:AraC-like DNA-binding protein
MKTADFLKAQLKENSLRIYGRLLEKEWSFEDLKQELNLSSPVLSKHLQRLGVWGMVERNPINRKYRTTIWKPKFEDLSSVWEGTDLDSILAATRVYLEFLDRLPAGYDKRGMIFSLLKSMFGRMTGNLVLNISEAIKCPQQDQLLEHLEKLYSNYLHPMGQILALVSWHNRKLIGPLLRSVGSEFLEDADDDFQIGRALEAIKKSKLRSAPSAATDQKV